MAIKVFTLNAASQHAQQLVTEFERLMDAPLDHPVIVRPLIAGLHEGTPYVACDYLETDAGNGSVRQTGVGPPVPVLQMATHLAGALDFAAVVNVHHGALHARDVLVHGDAVRITGMGIAQALQQAGVTADHQRYAASRGADARQRRDTDILALASVIHELWFSVPQTIDLRQGIESTRSTPDSDTAVFHEVFEHVLRAHQEEKFQTALEFVRALMNACGAVDVSPIQSRDDTPSLGSTPEENATRLVPSDRAEHPPAPKRTPVFASAALVALASVFAASAAGGCFARYGVGLDGSLVRSMMQSRLASEKTQHPATKPASPLPPSQDNTAIAPPSTSLNESRVEEPANVRAGRVTPAPTKTAPPSAPRAGESAVGMLFIDSRPRGADVFLDERLIGTTPLAVVAPGNHLVRLERDGSRSWSGPVLVDSRRFNRLAVDLSQ